MSRTLASIQTIDALTPIEGADAIETATGFIYKITNATNGKVYVGQSIFPLSHIEKRYRKEMRYRSEPRAINRAMAHHGIDNFSFEIIESAPLDQLDAREQFWVAELRSNVYGEGYNLTEGGKSTRGLKWSDESRKRLSQSMKGKMSGEANPFYGKTHSQYVRDCTAASNRRRTGMKHKPHSDVAKAKMGAARKGKCVGKDNHRFISVDSDALRSLISSGATMPMITSTFGTDHNTIYRKIRSQLGFNGLREARKKLCVS